MNPTHPMNPPTQARPASLPALRRERHFSDRVMIEVQTLTLAQRLANGPTQAPGEIKKLLRGSQQTSLPDQLDAEAAAFLRCAGTDDFRGAVDSFLLKRPIEFTGR